MWSHSKAEHSERELGAGWGLGLHSRVRKEFGFEGGFRRTCSSRTGPGKGLDPGSHVVLCWWHRAAGSGGGRAAWRAQDRLRGEF